MDHTLPIAFMSLPGGTEWIVIGLIALLLFGKRLPGVAKSLGQSMHAFKSGLNGAADKMEENPEEKEKEKEISKIDAEK